MSHLYKCTEWEANGQYHVNDVSELGTNPGLWWHPCRILDMTPAEFVVFIKEKFNASNFSYTNMLHFSFDKLEDSRKYKNYINKMARQKNFII